MALSDFGRLWSLARKVEDLFKLQTEVRAALNIIDERLRAIENRMTKLEAEQMQIATEARSAAASASTVIVANVISEVVTRITRLEGRADQAEARRLRRPLGITPDLGVVPPSFRRYLEGRARFGTSARHRSRD